MFYPKFINLDIEVNNEQQLFDLVGTGVIESKFANSGYISGLKERELVYPTGLQFAELSIALPHVDSKYILRPFIYVARNKVDIKVRQMGDGRDMKTKNFLFLGLKDSTKQPKLLANIISSLQNSEFVNSFLSTNEETEMLKLLQETFNKNE
jgi:PTS system galactitol-specific IIA component